MDSYASETLYFQLSAFLISEDNGAYLIDVLFKVDPLLSLTAW